MRAYITQHTEYQVSKTGDLEAIPSFIGSHRGEKYGIVGFLGKENHVDVMVIEGSGHFFSTRDGKNEPIGYEDLPKFLDQAAAKGKRIVARLLDKDGRFAPLGAPDQFLVTTEIRDIREN